MIGQCEQCGLTNVEVRPTKTESNKTRTLCNQCRPADGAYAYWDSAWYLEFKDLQVYAFILL